MAALDLTQLTFEEKSLYVPPTSELVEGNHSIFQL